MMLKLAITKLLLWMLMAVFISPGLTTTGIVKHKLTIAGLVPADSDGAWSCSGIIPAIDMAIVDVNNRSDILTDYELTWDWRDTKAYKQGMYGSSYAWFIPGFYSEGWWKTKDPNVDCTSNELRIAMQSAIETVQDAKRYDNVTSINGETFAEYEERYHHVINSTPAYSEIIPHMWHSLGYDAVWSVALALNASIDDVALMKMNDTPGTSRDKRLDDFTYTDNEMAAIFRKSFQNVSFQGTSGKVCFDKNQDRIGRVGISQIWGGEPPLDEQSWSYKVVTVGKALFVTAYILSSIGIAAAVVSKWLICIGFTLSFGSMFAKTWRVHRIFTTLKARTLVMKDIGLITFVCILCVVDVVVLTTWQIVDPYLAFLEDMHDFMSDDTITKTLYQRYSCTSQFEWYWTGSICGIKGLLLLFGCFLAFETRNVQVEGLNDSRQISISVYNIMVSSIVVISLSFALKSDPFLGFAFVMFPIWICTSMTLSMMFIPKVDASQCINVHDKIYWWLSCNGKLHWKRKEGNMKNSASEDSDTKNTNNIIKTMYICFLLTL
uniref:Gamma-aminobutyric acid type B receptor subunit 2-like n=1 Tax=Saccoglossus kowalevskii TaxID=10224 RepID=A0ABM0MZQ4_SACKO|nr:PREDICTED: gamma-aminobutyric acid type B receptor subunit 2-like [Saccoglossus kowalevskii]